MKSDHKIDSGASSGAIKSWFDLFDDISDVSLDSETIHISTSGTEYDYSTGTQWESQAELGGKLNVLEGRDKSYTSDITATLLFGTALRVHPTEVLRSSRDMEAGNLTTELVAGAGLAESRVSVVPGENENDEHAEVGSVHGIAQGHQSEPVRSESVTEVMAFGVRESNGMCCELKFNISGTQDKSKRRLTASRLKRETQRRRQGFVLCESSTTRGSPGNQFFDEWDAKWRVAPSNLENCGVKSESIADCCTCHETVPLLVGEDGFILPNLEFQGCQKTTTRSTGESESIDFNSNTSSKEVVDVIDVSVEHQSRKKPRSVKGRHIARLKKQLHCSTEIRLELSSANKILSDMLQILEEKCHLLEQSLCIRTTRTAELETAYHGADREKRSALQDIWKLSEKYNAQILSSEEERFQRQDLIEQLESARQSWEKEIAALQFQLAVETKGCAESMLLLQERDIQLSGQVHTLNEELQLKQILLEEMSKRAVASEEKCLQKHQECKRERESNHKWRQSCDELVAAIQRKETAVERQDAKRRFSQQTVRNLETQLSAQTSAVISTRFELDHVYAEFKAQVEAHREVVQAITHARDAAVLHSHDVTKSLESCQQTIRGLKEDHVTVSASLMDTHQKFIRLDDQRKAELQLLRDENSALRLLLENGSSEYRQKSEGWMTSDMNWKSQYQALQQEKEAVSLQYL